ncbi:MAG: VWA domain-containing protein [Acidobacteriota bacterium]
MFRFLHPWWLLLLVGLPAAIGWIRRRDAGRSRSVRFSALALLDGLPRSWAARLRHGLLTGLRVAGLVLAVIALARPQAGHSEEEILTRGIDIMVVIDHSGSMAAEDFKPRNRLHVAKEVVAGFIGGRRHDRIGMVTFAARALTLCPLTLDYMLVQQALEEIELARKDEDGTAIGMGLASAVNRLRRSQAKSRVIILLTDGRNNRGHIDPLTAAQVARAFDVKVHVIGVGTQGEARFPIDDPMFGKRYAMMRVDLDEETLTGIANATGGLYFRATDSESLLRIFEQIDALERTDIKVRQYVQYAELFAYFLWPSALLLGLEQLLRHTWLRAIP